jgi:hypothetical protein
LRKLRTAYTGDAIRVRRADNNDEADIGFNVFGELDTVSLAAHCGANDGFVVTWYDQSGSANDATQSTTANQPKIYDGTTGVVLDEDNNRPAVLFAGDYLASGAVTAAGTATNFAVGNISGGSSTMALFYTPEAFNYYPVSNWTVYSSGPTIYAGNEQGLLLHYFGANGSGNFGAINGGTQTTGTNVAASANRISIGTQSSNAIRFYGYIQECIYYGSDESTNRTNIEDNINTFYSIY